MEFTTALGLAAASCSVLSFLPQVLKIWKTRHTADLSIMTFIILFIGSIFWFTYGMILRDIPICIANGLITVLMILILILKIKYG
jgi:MtN3 and saliva related transmembrane protein